MKEEKQHDEGTELEELTGQLGLRSGPGSYPERPGQSDCNFYLRTGSCDYGNRCRFNHPRDRSMAREVTEGGGDLPERVGQPVCEFFMRTGICAFGPYCKYNHPKYGTQSSTLVTRNLYGYPFRPAEKECLYYLKTGQCKFGVTCRFHHPQPVGLPDPPSVVPPSAALATFHIPGGGLSRESYGRMPLLPVLVGTMYPVEETTLGNDVGGDDNIN